MSREYKAFGALFPNHKKMGKQPDYKGEIEMGGVKYELAGWIRDSNLRGKIMEAFDLMTAADLIGWLHRHGIKVSHMMSKRRLMEQYGWAIKETR